MKLSQCIAAGLLVLPMALATGCGLTGEEWAEILGTASDVYIADREAKRAQRNANAAQANLQAMQAQQFQYQAPPTYHYHQHQHQAGRR